LAIAAGAPDAGAALIGGSQQFAMASFVQFTQAQESQADQAAITYMEGSGQSPVGLLSFAERNFRYNEMLSASRIPPWMRTHPLWSDRIQALRARVDAAPTRGVKDSAKEVEQLKLIQAKLYGYIEHPARTAQKYPEKDVSAAARYARAVAAMRIGDLDRAREQANLLAKEFPTDPYYQELLGEIYIGNGKPVDALPYHRRALELSPGNALLQVNLGRALVATQDNAKLDEALTMLHKAVRSEPDNATAWNEIAQAYSRKGEDGQAKLATAELRFAVGDWPGARSFAERAKQTLAQNTPAWRRAADIAVIAETRTRPGRS
jgi:predicted Zn-dependent protease